MRDQPMWQTVRTVPLLMILSTVCQSAFAEDSNNRPIQLKTVGDDTYAVRLLFEDDFADLSHWVVEGEGRVDAVAGRLIWDCVREKETAGTIWCRQPFQGPTIVEYDAVAEDGRDNLNFIAYATHPPDGLLTTSDKRTGAYQEYHQFPNYIVTYLPSARVPDATPVAGSSSDWRVRFRRNPGFHLLSETVVASQRPPARQQRLTYVFDSGGVMSFFVDGRLVQRFEDTDAPLREGRHGFRTWKSLVRYSDFKVYQIETDLRDSPDVLHRSGRALFVNSPIDIDGLLDDPGWRDVPDLKPYVFTWREDSIKQATRTKMAWDDEYLYVAFQCEDIHVQAVLTERDSPVSGDDCVELFAAPDPGRVEDHLVLEMNARGAYLDSIWINNRPRTSEPFNPEGIKIAVAVDGTLNDERDSDRGWTLELAFPFAALGDLAPSIPPQPGDVWRLNLNRADHTPDRVRSMWSPIISERVSFHQPEFFGHVTFVK